MPRPCTVVLDQQGDAAFQSLGLGEAMSFAVASECQLGFNRQSGRNSHG
jgi:hypothetical protein